jgi:hypothetical protein
MRNNAWTPLGYSYHDAFASSALAICCTTNPDLLDFRTYRIPRDLYRPSERKVAAGRCRKQAPRVVLPRCEKNIRYQPLLDDSALVQHNDPVADLARHTQIMRNKENANRSEPLDFLQQGEDLRLHRHIESRDRFVCNEKLGFAGQRPCY